MRNSSKIQYSVPKKVIFSSKVCVKTLQKILISFACRIVSSFFHIQDQQFRFYKPEGLQDIQIHNTSRLRLSKLWWMPKIGGGLEVWWVKNICSILLPIIFLVLRPLRQSCLQICKFKTLCGDDACELTRYRIYEPMS